jgi:hypothetical protein
VTGPQRAWYCGRWEGRGGRGCGAHQRRPRARGCRRRRAVPHTAGGPAHAPVCGARTGEPRSFGSHSQRPHNSMYIVAARCWPDRRRPGGRSFSISLFLSLSLSLSFSLPLPLSLRLPLPVCLSHPSLAFSLPLPLSLSPPSPSLPPSLPRFSLLSSEREREKVQQLMIQLMVQQQMIQVQQVAMIRKPTASSCRRRHDAGPRPTAAP